MGWGFEIDSRLLDPFPQDNEELSSGATGRIWWTSVCLLDEAGDGVDVVAPPAGLPA